MTTYTVNQSGSATATFPASLKRGDVMNIYNTSTGQSGAILKWTIPNDGVYRIVAMGAQGGGANGGKGALMSGDFILRKNQVLSILIGHRGIYSESTYKIGGGGGGTFIAKENLPLLIAGGGGGYTYTWRDLDGYPGEISKLASEVPGGKPSKGEGNGASHGGGTGGAGGAGFNTNGFNDTQYGESYGSAGIRFLSGGLGGKGYNDCHGGFGGGGGGGYSGGGGGGGYTGGHGAGNMGSPISAGAGSYNIGENQTNTRGYKSGHGLVQITFIGSANEPPTDPSLVKQPVSNSMNLSNETISLEWTASTDPEGNAIRYEIDFYNGSTWVSIAKDITGSTYDGILPICNTSNAQFRVRAFDNENDASPYTMSNVFTVAAQLALVRDGDNVKTYKDGVWTVI
ncbi:glycine-rich protein [Bacillus cereus]|uniref:glycine-rich protein n=1 Tax=Bacillus cereus TaxID=1396 RepID=UPI00032EB634|nr:glycine-rich protein [Bacillus cereus]EOO44539.1 hypothetical protein ICK_06314 [Bacillus cereus BAG1X2-2]